MAMSITLIKASRYLRKEDCEPPLTLTIERIEQENVAADGSDEAKVRFVIFFRDEDKGFVINWTNGQLGARIFGSSNMEQWIGKPITLYHDPSVSFQGKLVGGIRLRAPDFSDPAESNSGPNDDIPLANS